MKNSPIGRIMCARFVVLFFAAILLPASIGAQTLSVTPTSVSVQANAGTNAPSQTVQVRKTGAGALRWSIPVPNGGWPSWLSVPPTSGMNNGTLILTFTTSSLPAGTYPSPPPFSFTVQAGQQSVPVAVTLTIVGSAPPPPPPPLTVTCPTNKSVASPDGKPVVVNNGTATASGGVPPYTYSYTRSDGQSGTSFPVGVTTITATATDSQPASKQCQFTVTINYTPPPPPSVD